MSLRDARALHSVTVVIAGEKHVLRSAAEPEYTRAVAAHVDATLRKLDVGALEPHRAAILAALFVTDELFRARDQLRRLREDVEQQTLRLAERLEQGATDAGRESPPPPAVESAADSPGEDSPPFSLIAPTPAFRIFRSGVGLRRCGSAAYLSVPLCRSRIRNSSVDPDARVAGIQLFATFLFGRRAGVPPPRNDDISMQIIFFVLALLVRGSGGVRSPDARSCRPDCGVPARPQRRRRLRIRGAAEQEAEHLRKDRASRGQGRSIPREGGVGAGGGTAARRVEALGTTESPSAKPRSTASSSSWTTRPRRRKSAERHWPSGSVRCRRQSGRTSGKSWCRSSIGWNPWPG